MRTLAIIFFVCVSACCFSQDCFENVSNTITRHCDAVECFSFSSDCEISYLKVELLSRWGTPIYSIKQKKDAVNTRVIEQYLNSDELMNKIKPGVCHLVVTYKLVSNPKEELSFHSMINILEN